MSYEYVIFGMTRSQVEVEVEVYQVQQQQLCFLCLLWVAT